MQFRILSLLFLAWQLSTAGLRAQYAEGEVIIEFKPGVSEAAIEAFYQEHPTTLRERLQERRQQRRERRWARLQDRGRDTMQWVRELERDDRVLFAEPNYERYIKATPDDESFHQQWGLENYGQFINGVFGVSGADVGFLEAWPLARDSGEEIVVAVMDTGADISHPDLQANIWTNSLEIPANGIDDDFNGYIDDVNGYDFALDDGVMFDVNGHGTHLAGIIGAVGFNERGVIGINPRVKILPLKVSLNGSTMLISSITEACDYVVSLKQRGVNIVAVNASYGASTFSSTERQAIADLNAAGIILCAAAGNEAVNNDLTPSYPANYALSNIIAVAASNNRNQLADFSNYGVLTVDLAAPGDEIYSTTPLDTVGFDARVTSGGLQFTAQEIEFAGLTPDTGLTGVLVDCGIGNPQQFPPTVTGGIALIERGTLTFNEKVGNAMAAGAIAVVIYDNTADPIGSGAWTLGASSDWIPAVRVTRADGLQLAQQGTVTVFNLLDDAAAYDYKTGTSMATPMVVGAVAFAALNFPNENVSDRRARVLDNVTPVSAFNNLVRAKGVLNLRRIVDTDLDDLPDWWEQLYFNNLSENGASDPDQDGYTTAEEFLAMTNPGSALDQPHFASLKSVGETFTLSFATANGRSYRVEWSDTLAPDSWQRLTTVVGTGAIEEVADDLNTDLRRFYRLIVFATE